MNVALFASAFYPHLGGVEEMVRQLAHSFEDRGVSTVILTNRWPRNLPAFQMFEGIPLYRMPFRVPEGSAKAHLTYRLTHRRIRHEVFEAMRRHRIDLMNVQCVSANGFYANLASEELDLPIVVSTHGERYIDASDLYGRSPFANHTLRVLLRRASAVTACSADTLDDLERYWGTPFGPRGHVISNGIEPDDFEFVAPCERPRPYILAMGRLVRQKGFDVLIRAFAQSGIRSHDLVIAGEGPERPRLEWLRQEFGLTDRIELHGRAERPVAIALFKGCSFFVAPSRQEPLGIVNLEAMAAGKAVVASRVGGIPDVVLHGKTGLLVSPEDPGSLAGALRLLSSDTELRESLAKAGASRSAEFNWSRAAERFLGIFEQALRSRPRFGASAAVPAEVARL